MPTSSAYSAGGDANLAATPYAGPSGSGAPQSRVLDEMVERQRACLMRDDAVDVLALPSGCVEQPIHEAGKVLG